MQPSGRCGVRVGAGGGIARHLEELFIGLYLAMASRKAHKGPPLSLCSCGV